MITRKFLAACLLCAAVSLATPRPAAAEKMTVALGSGAFFFTLQYIADAGGFFKEQGLEVETVDLTTGPRQTAAVMGGSVDGAMQGLQLVVQAVMRGGDIVAISTGYNVMPISLTLSNDAIARTGATLDMPIDERVKRLRGLRIGVTTPGSGSDDVLQSLLKARGMNPETDITVQPLGGADAMLAAMARGATDGFMYTSPVPEIAAQRGIGRIIVEPLNGDVPELRDLPYITFVTSRATLAKKRPQMLGMVRAYTKAMTFIQQNPAEAARLTHRFFPDVDAAIFNAAFAKYTKGLPTSPLITPDQVTKLITWMNLAKKTKITGSYAEVVDPSIAEQVIKEMPGR